MTHRFKLIGIMLSGIVALAACVVLIIPFGLVGFIEWLFRGKSYLYTPMDKIMTYFEWSTSPWLVEEWLKNR